MDAVSRNVVPLRPSLRRRNRRELVQPLAAEQGGVVSRAQLYEAGISRGEVRHNLRAQRWQTIGRHCIAVHTGGLGDQAKLWAAVLEGGPRAFLDGESALVAAGLEHYAPSSIRVTVPRGARIRHRGTVANIRQTRRWAPDDVVPGSSPPRARPAVAAVRAALWAWTERQAALLLTMPVQQGLVTVEDLGLEMLRIRRDKRRIFLHRIVIDLAGGVRSLGELDVVRGCRERALPEPDSQVLRRSPTGTSYYLDFRWERWAVVLEVDGIQHTWVQNLVADALRHNDIAVSGDVVLRLPVLGLRVCPDAFFAQLESALVRAGWDRTRRSA